MRPERQVNSNGTMQMEVGGIERDRSWEAYAVAACISRITRQPGGSRPGTFGGEIA